MSEIQLLTLDDVRGIVRCSKSKLYKDRCAGKLQVVKLGGLVRVTRKQFEAYLRLGRANRPAKKVARRGQ